MPTKKHRVDALECMEKPVCAHHPYMLEGFLTWYMYCPRCGLTGPEELTETAALLGWKRLTPQYWSARQKKRQVRRGQKMRRGF